MGSLGAYFGCLVLIKRLAPLSALGQTVAENRTYPEVAEGPRTDMDDEAKP